MQLLFDENQQDRTASLLYSEFINTEIKNARSLQAFLPSILLFVNRVNGY